MEFSQQLIVVLSSLAIVLAAWYAGARWAMRQQRTDSEPLSKASYFRGLNFLINEEPDETIDTFISSLEVTPETLETHLSLGALMRRRGEVERGIRIHQNLLSHPKLSRNQLYQVQLELARDFMQAGLLDRAERLMLDLIEMSDQYRKAALEHLLQIYRDEQEWQKAIAVADKLWPRRLIFGASPGSEERGHFCCELAEQALHHGDLLEVRRQLRQALKYDKNSVRASLLLARLDVQQGNYPGALKRLGKIADQDAALLPEAVELICQAYRQQGRESELIECLSALYRRYPGTTLLLAWADGVFQSKGRQEAVALLRQQLDNSPSLPVLLQLLSWECPSDDEQRDSAALMAATLRKLQDSRSQYRCHDCGFSAQQMHWLCPACKKWSTVKPVKDNP